MAGAKENTEYIAWLIIFGLWAAVHLALANTIGAPVFDGELLGPDGYMRLIRVAELRDGSGWYDAVIERSNAPFGDRLHWTRPMDVLILLIAGAASLFTDRGEALFIAGAIAAPLTGFFACFVMAWAARPLIGKNRAILAVFILLLQPGVLSYTMAGRADHHALQFVAFIFCVGTSLRLLDKATPVKAAALAGLSYGLALWVSIELILLVALCQLAMVLCWLLDGRDRAGPLLATAGAFFATTGATLLVEWPPADLLTVAYDRLSIVHLTLAGLTLCFWAAAYGMERYAAARAASPDARHRMALAAIAAGASVAILSTLFSDFFAGPFATMDPRIIPIWHERVGELAPLVPTDLKLLGRFLFFIGAAVPCLIFVGVLIWRPRSDLSGIRWGFLAALLAVYFVLALRHLRFAPFAEIVSVWVLAEMVGRLMEWSERALSGLRQFAVKCGATFAILVGTLLAGTFVITLSPAVEASEPEPECRLSRIAALLNDPDGLGARPLVISGLLDHGPQIIYRTPHAAVGTPYHRNGDGIWDSHRLLATSDEQESRAIIDRRRIELILICPSKVERDFYMPQPDAKNLYSRLIAGDSPAWLTPVPLDPSTAAGFRLYRVAP